MNQLTPRELAVAVAVQVALLATLTGLVVRGRWRLNRSFSIYLAMALTGNMLSTLWPARFHVSDFWMAKQSVYDVLKLAIVLELAVSMFRRFPGAEATARKALFAILAITALSAAAVVKGKWGADLYPGMSQQLHARVAVGTIWVLATILALARWYRVPVHPFQAAVVTGYAVYLTVLAVLLNLMGRYGMGFRAYVAALDPPAYLLVACWWAYVAWRQDDTASVAHVETLRKLQLRAESCG